MTITTKCTIHCDVGQVCIKQIVKTIVGPAAPVEIRRWASEHGWKDYGGRIVCPECWKALHAPTARPDRDLDEDVQTAIDGERGG